VSLRPTQAHRFQQVQRTNTRDCRSGSGLLERHSDKTLRREVIDLCRLRKLNQSLRAALDAEDVKERIAADGAVVNPSTPEEYATDIDREEAKWAKVVQLAKAPK